MAIQTKALTAVAINVSPADEFPNQDESMQVGNHLRWSFPFEKGFPLFGFYVLRRPHDKNRTLPHKLSRILSQQNSHAVNGSSLDINFPFGVVSISTDALGLNLSDRFTLPISDGQPPVFAQDRLLEVELTGSKIVDIIFPDACWCVELTFGFIDDAQVDITAKQWGEDVYNATVSKRNPILKLQHNAITSIELTVKGVDVSLCDVVFQTVNDGAHEDWTIPSHAKKPFLLPCSHKDYPLSTRENLELSRSEAKARVRYALPPEFKFSTTPIDDTGKVVVTKGSMLVQGRRTHWSPQLVGSVLKIPSHRSAYVITDVIDNNHILLSRPWEGRTQNDINYTIENDSFAQLYDSLIHLVNQSQSIPMASKQIPYVLSTVQNANVTVTTQLDKKIISGSGTRWNKSIESHNILFSLFAGSIINIDNKKNTAIIFTSPSNNFERTIIGNIIQINRSPVLYKIVGLSSPNNLIVDKPFINSFGVNPNTLTYTIFDSTHYEIESVINSSSLELTKKYIGPSKSNRGFVITGRLKSRIDEKNSPQMQDVNILSMALLSSLNPAYAQMLGLYWIDSSDEIEKQKFDYMIVSDYNGDFTNNIIKEFDDTSSANFSAAFKAWLINNNRHTTPNIDAYIISGIDNNERQHPVKPPKDINAYVLPTPTLKGSSFRDTRNTVGIRFKADQSFATKRYPNDPVRIHLSRSEYDIPNTINSVEIPNIATPTKNKKRIAQNQGALVGNSDHTALTVNPLPGWPNFLFDYLDVGVEDGWYKYRAQGVDLFGRHSELSTPASWKSWQPEKTEHPSAVRVIDLTPPPAPSFVTAQALDIEDPYVIKDASYLAWRAQNDSILGVRVGWLWTERQARQAPDTQRFNIYYRSGRANAFSCYLESISVISSNEIILRCQLDQVNSVDIAQDYFASCTLQYKGFSLFIKQSEPVNASQKAINLKVETSFSYHSLGEIKPNPQRSSRIFGEHTSWHNALENSIIVFTQGKVTAVITKVISPTEIILDRDLDAISSSRSYNIYRLPKARSFFSIEVPKISPVHQAWIDLSRASSWPENNWPSQTQPFSLINDNVSSVLEIRKNQEGEELIGKLAQVSGQQARIFFDALGQEQADLSRIVPTEDFIEFSTPAGLSRHRILSVDTQINTLTFLGQAPAGLISDWKVGLPMVQYEMFLPLTDQQLIVNQSNPIAYADVGVTAVDKNGNESPIGGPAKIVRVLRQPPPPPKLPPLEDEELLASPADFYAKSYFSFRWERASFSSYTHVFRALDSMLFKTDWQLRTTRGNLSTNNKHQKALGLYDDLRNKAAAITVVNSINRQTSPSDLTKSAWVLLSRLPGNGGILSEADLNSKSALTTTEVNAKKIQLLSREKQIRLSRGPIEPSQDHERFPDEPRWASGNNTSASQRRRVAVSDAINSLNVVIQPENYNEVLYSVLSSDAVRILAALPANDIAFTKLTAKPIASDDPNYKNKRGRDDDDRFVLNQPSNPLASSQLQRFEDYLDGRSENRYIYRASTSDFSANESELCFPLPPVRCPQITPLPKPVITKAVAGNLDPASEGDFNITITWVSSKNPRADFYRVYRTDNKSMATDLRSMTLIGDSIPVGLDKTTSWVDKDAPSESVHYYRAVLLDNNGNISQPSNVVSAKSFGIVGPDSPQWQPAIIDQTAGQIQLTWTANNPQLKCLVQRKFTSATQWQNISPWKNRGDYAFNDDFNSADEDRSYRLVVIDAQGKANTKFSELRVDI